MSIVLVLLTLGFVTNTTIPEIIRFTKWNRKGAYKNISSVAVGTHVWLIFLCESEKGGAAYNAYLQNPVHDIKKLADASRETEFAAKMAWYTVMEFLRFWFTQSKRSTFQNLLLKAFNSERLLLKNWKW